MTKETPALPVGGAPADAGKLSFFAFIAKL
jgi:hypothetical protein